MTLPETTSSRWAATEGLPFPLGPTRIEEQDACNFALYSKHAESVTLLLYTESDIVTPVLAYQFDYLKNKTGRIWHCRIPLVSMRGASYYAYRVEGPSSREPNGRLRRCARCRRPGRASCAAVRTLRRPKWSRATCCSSKKGTPFLRTHG